MITLFPSYPTFPNQPDPSFGAEVNAAKKNGFKIAFVDLELQLGGDVILRRFPSDDRAIYRGWLLKPEDYKKLDYAITEFTGSVFHTKYDSYLEAYEFPRWYSKFEGLTPRSIVIENPNNEWDFSAITSLVKGEFGDGPIMLKDYVKSRKQDWFEACFMANASDSENVKRVVTNFLRLTEGTIAGGLVFRKFETYKQIGIHAKTRMPVINEWRGFMVNDQCIYTAPYWADGDYSNVAKPHAKLFNDLAGQAKITSPFYSLDIAETIDGGWDVIEINDGGSSGVPEGGNIKDFYQALAGALIV